MMEFQKYIACICEGTAEYVIMELLLDNNKLQFTREDLLEEELLKCRSAKKFEEQHLRKGFTEKITVLRILDSRSERFNLSKAYVHKIKVINVITAPEIEMLIIIKENKYNEYQKFKNANMKPSEFCKSILRYSNVKSAEFIKEYFSDVNSLVRAIREYKRVSNIQRGEYALADLLK